MLFFHQCYMPHFYINVGFPKEFKLLGAHRAHHMTLQPPGRIQTAKFIAPPRLPTISSLTVIVIRIKEYANNEGSRAWNAPNRHPM
jgi:hypothetical protein